MLFVVDVCQIGKMFALTCFLYSVLAVLFLSDTDYLCVCALTGGAGTK